MTTRGIPFQPDKAAKIAKLDPGAIIRTRRTIKQYQKWWKHVGPHPNGGWWASDGPLDDRNATDRGFDCPYGVPGDSLYVREAFRFSESWDSTKPSEVDRILKDIGRIHYEGDGDPPEWAGKKRPAMFHPKIFSRSSLLIREVRVERVREIIYGDCLKEGYPHEIGDCVTGMPTPFKWFRNLWESIYGEEAWDMFVWVITAKKE